MGTPAEAVDVDYLPRQSMLHSGFSQDQAETLLRSMDLRMQNYLTKDYFDKALERFSAQVSQDILRSQESLRSEMAVEFSNVKKEISDRQNKTIVWMFGVVFTSIGVALTAIRLLFF
jgi:hypothetical protein